MTCITPKIIGYILLIVIFFGAPLYFWLKENELTIWDDEPTITWIISAILTVAGMVLIN